MPEKYTTDERAALIVLALANREVPNADLRKEFGIELKPGGRDKLNKAGLLKTRQEGPRYFHTITRPGRTWCERELAVVEAPPRTGPLVRAVFGLLRRMVQEHGIRLAGGDLEELIRAAYHELSVKPQDWVRLAKLRPKLDGVDQDEVDRVLVAMARTGRVHLAPDSNRKALTEADHAAAVQIGTESNHLVAIEES